MNPFIALASRLYAERLRRDELSARLVAGAEWLDWIERAVPAHLPGIPLPEDNQKPPPTRRYATTTDHTAWAPGIQCPLCLGNPPLCYHPVLEGPIP